METLGVLWNILSFTQLTPPFSKPKFATTEEYCTRILIMFQSQEISVQSASKRNWYLPSYKKELGREKWNIHLKRAHNKEELQGEELLRSDLKKIAMCRTIRGGIPHSVWLTSSSRWKVWLFSQHERCSCRSTITKSALANKVLRRTRHFYYFEQICRIQPVHTLSMKTLRAHLPSLMATWVKPYSELNQSNARFFTFKTVFFTGSTPSLEVRSVALKGSSSCK